MGFNHILRKIYVRIAWNSTTSCEKSTSASRGIQPHLAKNRVPIWKNIDTRPRTPTPAPQNKVKPKQLLILCKKVSSFFQSRGVCAVNFVLGARGGPAPQRVSIFFQIRTVSRSVASSLARAFARALSTTLCGTRAARSPRVRYEDSFVRD